MSGTISFMGMSSNQNMNAYVDALVSLRRDAYIKPLAQRKADHEGKLESVGTIDAALASFYNTVRVMDRVGEFMVRQAVSSNPSVVTASADSTAALGSYTIDVNRLAGAEMEVHQGIADSIQFHAGVTDPTAAINSSGGPASFVYGYAGAVRTVMVNDGETLEDLRDAINNDPGNPGVTAGITALNGTHHLVLSETVPDPAHEIQIDPRNDMSLDGSAGTVDLTANAFRQTVNASGSDQIFQFQYGGNDPVEITLSTGATLAQLRDQINFAQTGVRASILDDGGTGSGAIHLVLTGADTGSDFSISVNAGGGGTTTLDGSALTVDFTQNAFSETEAARNARIRVNGYPAGPPWIERPGNRITDVIQGVTLNLGSTGTAATVAVSPDISGVVRQVEAFTEAFNAVRSAIREATRYDAASKTAGSLLGNYAVQIIKTRLDRIITGNVAGFRDSEDVYSSLQQLGFSTDTLEGSATEGQLLLDTTRLQGALDQDPDAVARLFSAHLDGVTDNDRITFSSSLSTASAGIYNVEIDTDAGRGRFRIQGGQWGEWVDLAGTDGAYSLTGVAGPERGIALSVSQAAGTGTHTAVLRLRSGAAAQLSAELTGLLSTSGPLKTLRNNVTDITENIEKRIDQEEQRIGRYEALLRKRFARLDVYISRMTSLSDAIAAMTSGLMKSSGS